MKFGGSWNKTGPSFEPKSRNDALENTHKLLTIPQFGYMGDLLWRLETEPKTFWRQAIPSPNRFAVRDPIKGVVDLGR